MFYTSTHLNSLKTARVEVVTDSFYQQEGLPGLYTENMKKKPKNKSQEEMWF